jgi:SAM-dependent methyltransferase
MVVARTAEYLRTRGQRWGDAMSLPNERRKQGAAFLWDSIGDDYGSVSPFLVETAELLVDRAALRPGERVIDLGTGNGHGLVPAAKAVAPALVVGVDLSNGMLDAARARARAAGVENIQLRNMDVSELEFPDASFDVALASTVFQFVGYSPDALVEWRRVLAPGGRLLMSVPVSLGLIEDLMKEFFVRIPDEIQTAWRESGGSVPGTRQVPDLAELCVQSGFTTAEAEDIHRVHTFPSMDAWWAFHWTHGSRAVFVCLPEDALADMRAEAERRLAPSVLPNGEVPIETAMRVCRANT